VNKLRVLLSINALSCLGFGSVFFLWPALTAVYLSGDTPAPDGALQLLGAGLVLHGLHLLSEAARQTPRRTWVIYFYTGDFLWVIGTVLLIISNQWITTTAGMTAALAVALMVGLFGVLQYAYCPSESTSAAIS